MREKLKAKLQKIKKIKPKERPKKPHPRWEKVKAWYYAHVKHYGIVLFVLAIILMIVIETLGRHSLIQAFAFMVGHPIIFFCNVMLIFAVISLSLLFKRRIFATCMLSILWIALGITNGVILANRMTPFNVKDMSNLGDGLSIVSNYFSVKTVVLVLLAVAALVVVIIALFRKTPRLKKVNYKKEIAIVLVIVLSTFGVLEAGMKTGVLDTFFPNLAYAYRDNGVPYSFMITWVKTGIDKPHGYDEEMIEDIFKGGELGKDNIYTIGKDDDLNVENKPNILFLQLESFIDLSVVNDIELSEDPTPYFRELKKNYSSGKLEVPAVGAGTANIEFETMTGISTKFFGPGEYPYKSIVMDTTVETTPYDLKQLGYTAHAIHNHRGAFYNRNKVFPNMGFDTFTCLEYMHDVAKTPKNWAKDQLLTDRITDAMESTKGPDYIYTISVQGHGKYPTEEVIADPEITVTKAPTEEKKWAYEYYANQIHEMDEFLRELTATLENYDENVVLVIYGDHLPALDMTEEELTTGDLYASEYVIWDNFGMSKEDKDKSTYNLSAHVLKKLGISVGMMNKYHQNYEGKKNYLSNLETLSYDMLYGKHYIYGGENPYKRTKMKMGVKPIKIEEIVKIGEKFYIKGKNFTEYSKISLDGEALKTVYLSPTLLALNEKVDPARAKDMKVSQIEKNNEVLSTTE